MTTQNLKVFLRIRPSENDANHSPPMLILSDTCVAATSQVKSVITNDRSQSPQNGIKFDFEKVFPDDTSQEEVYARVVMPLIDSFLSGINCTVFAYGQTGSGKTYSLGSNALPLDREENGTIPRFLDQLFTTINTSSTIKVTANFFEIYNEDIIDLLSDSEHWESKSRPSTPMRNSARGEKIEIREDPVLGVYLTNINEVVIRNLNDGLRMLQKATSRRHTSSTLMNDVSSRSHAIFSFTLTQANINTSDPPEQTENTSDTSAPTPANVSIVSKFKFVDLAGSERLKRTKNTGLSKMEGIAINQGLLALGRVIDALVGGGSAVPYREAKITRVLQDSLGGNSKTSMIACVSSSHFDVGESINTMKYATRARKIENTSRVNLSILGSNKELEMMKLQFEEMKKKLAESESKCIALETENQQLKQNSSQLNSKTPSQEIPSVYQSASEIFPQQNPKLLHINMSKSDTASILMASKYFDLLSKVRLLRDTIQNELEHLDPDETHAVGVASVDSVKKKEGEVVSAGLPTSINGVGLSSRVPWVSGIWGSLTTPIRSKEKTVNI
ncbi:Kinesin-like protein kif21b [Nowakowskiella sp. JEL0407]|nr:Kinesin-like protein kif21b [Nowakowskiella sp. JEL0407]